MKTITQQSALKDNILIAYPLVKDGRELFFGRNIHHENKFFPVQSTLLQLKIIEYPCKA